MESKIKFVKTNEDWYGSFEPKEVYWKDIVNPFDCSTFVVSIKRSKNCCSKRGCWAVGAFGNDDFLLHKRHLGLDEALSLYHSIKDFTKQSELKKLGFNDD